MWTVVPGSYKFLSCSMDHNSLFHSVDSSQEVYDESGNSSFAQVIFQTLLPVMLPSVTNVCRSRKDVERRRTLVTFSHIVRGSGFCFHRHGEFVFASAVPFRSIFRVIKLSPHSLRLFIYIHIVTFIQYHVFLSGAYLQYLSSLIHINPNTGVLFSNLS